MRSLRVLPSPSGANPAALVPNPRPPCLERVPFSCLSCLSALCPAPPYHALPRWSRLRPIAPIRVPTAHPQICKSGRQGGRARGQQSGVRRLKAIVPRCTSAQGEGGARLTPGRLAVVSWQDGVRPARRVLGVTCSSAGGRPACLPRRPRPGRGDRQEGTLLLLLFPRSFFFGWWCWW